MDVDPGLQQLAAAHDQAMAALQPLKTTKPAGQGGL